MQPLVSSCNFQEAVENIKDLLHILTIIAKGEGFHEVTNERSQIEVSAWVGASSCCRNLAVNRARKQRLIFLRERCYPFCVVRECMSSIQQNEIWLHVDAILYKNYIDLFQRLVEQSSSSVDAIPN